MLVLLKAAAGAAPFATWVPVAETIGRGKSDKLDFYLKALYELLRDLMLLREGTGQIRNQDIRRELEPLATLRTCARLRRAALRVAFCAALARVTADPPRGMSRDPGFLRHTHARFASLLSVLPVAERTFDTTITPTTDIVATLATALVGSGDG